MNLLSLSRESSDSAALRLEQPLSAVKQALMACIVLIWALPGLIGRGLHWIAGEPPGGALPAEVEVRIRSRHPGVSATVESAGEAAGADASCRVRFHEPQASVAPGQAAVFYRGTQVLGGCWIVRALRN